MLNNRRLVKKAASKQKVNIKLIGFFIAIDL